MYQLTTDRQRNIDFVQPRSLYDGKSPGDEFRQSGTIIKKSLKIPLVVLGNEILFLLILDNTEVLHKLADQYFQRGDTQKAIKVSASAPRVR